MESRLNVQDLSPIERPATPSPPPYTTLPSIPMDEAAPELQSTTLSPTLEPAGPPTATTPARPQTASADETTASATRSHLSPLLAALDSQHHRNNSSRSGTSFHTTISSRHPRRFPASSTLSAAGDVSDLALDDTGPAAPRSPTLMQGYRIADLLASLPDPFQQPKPELELLDPFAAGIADEEGPIVEPEHTCSQRSPSVTNSSVTNQAVINKGPFAPRAAVPQMTAISPAGPSSSLEQKWLALFPKSKPGESWKRTALLVVSVQKAARANLTEAAERLTTTENNIGETLTVWRGQPKSDTGRRGPIIHIHTIRGHAVSEVQPAAWSDASKRVRSSRTWASSEIWSSIEGHASFRAHESGSQALAYAEPRMDEYTVIKSGASVFEYTAVSQILRWNHCDSCLIIGFDTPSLEMSSISFDEQEVVADTLHPPVGGRYLRFSERLPPTTTSVTLRSGADITNSVYDATRLGFTAGIVPGAHSTNVAQTRFPRRYA